MLSHFLPCFSPKKASQTVILCQYTRNNMTKKRKAHYPLACKEILCFFSYFTAKFQKKVLQKHIFQNLCGWWGARRQWRLFSADRGESLLRRDPARVRVPPSLSQTNTDVPPAHRYLFCGWWDSNPHGVATARF